MKTFLLIFFCLFISTVNIFPQNFNPLQYGYQNVQAQEEGEIDFDRINNQNQNEQAGTETQQINQPVSQNFTNMITMRFGFGYNALYNVKSVYNKDSAAFLFGLGYTGLFIRLKDNLRLGLSFNVDINDWTAASDEEGDLFYRFSIEKAVNTIAVEMSLMPVIKYNTLMLGVGMYLKINKSNWDLYKENTSDSDTDYTLFKNPKVKKADYGIIVLIGSFSKINDGLLGISLELKFSINKPILYYDYYNTGSFPYTARGFLLGEGNYFTIMIVFHLGVGW